MTGASGMKLFRRRNATRANEAMATDLPSTDQRYVHREPGAPPTKEQTISSEPLGHDEGVPPISVDFRFVVLVKDPDVASQLAELFEDLKEPSASAAFFVPPLRGREFLDWGGAWAWMDDHAVALQETIFLLEDEPGLPNALGRHDAVSYVGLDGADDGAYRVLGNARTFPYHSPLDFVVAVVHDFSEFGMGGGVLFSDQEAVRMEALASGPESIAGVEADETYLTDAGRLFDEGYALFNQSRFREALEQFERARDAGYTEVLIQGWLGETHIQLEEWDPAIDAANAALAIDSNDPESWKILGTALGMKQGLREALGAYDRAREIQNSVTISRSRGVLLNRLGETKLACEALEEAIAFDPSDSDPASSAAVHGWYGVVLHELGRHHEALDHYERAQRLGRKTAGLAIAHAICCSELQDYERALQQYALAVEQAEQEGDRSALSHALAGRAGVLCQQGEDEQARKTCEQSLQLGQDDTARPEDANTVATLSILAYVLNSQGRPEEAEVKVLRAVRVLEEGRRRAGNSRTTEWFHREGWRVYVVTATVANALGDLYSDKTEWRNAVQATEQAEEKLPIHLSDRERDDAARLFLERSWAYYRMGNRKDSARALEECCERCDPDSLMHLVARRRLRRVGASETRAPKWLAATVAAAAVGLGFVATLLLVAEKLSSGAFTSLILGSFFGVLVACYLPVVTQLRIGPAQFQKAAESESVPLPALSPVPPNIGSPEFQPPLRVWKPPDSSMDEQSRTAGEAAN